MGDDTERSVTLERTRLGHYRIHNRRGGTLTIGTGDDADFSPVELLLAAIGGCSAVDVDLITSRRAEPEQFLVQARGDKIRDRQGNRMTDLELRFTVSFGDDEGGDAARAMLPRAVRMSTERLCTVSRTVEVGTPIATTIIPATTPGPGDANGEATAANPGRSG